MPFPEFDSAKRKILFFSRGRGRGHAVCDVEVTRALQTLREDCEIRFVSYGTGAATLKELGFPLIDLGLPDDGSTAMVSVLAGRLIRWLRPELVLSHEEFAAALAAKIFDLPVVFLTDWFSGADTYAMSALTFADQVLFLGPAGVFDEPAWLAGKVTYLGPLLREFRSRREDRSRLRAELGIPEGALTISVFPGSWSEDRAPILDLVAEAFDSLPPPKRLFWVAGKDEEIVRSRFAGREDAVVLDHAWDIDRWMIASDAAITKTNRKTIYELSSLSVPSVALSFGLNPMDDRAASQIDGVVHLDARSIPADALARLLRELPRHEPPRAFAAVTGAGCAAYICRALDQALEARPAGTA